MAPSKEDFLERKLLCLEKRLTLIERFVEARFSESLQEFATPTPPPRPSFSRPAPASVKRKASEQVLEARFSPKIKKVESKNLGLKGVKDCVVQVTRLQLKPKDGKGCPSTSAASTSIDEIESVASRRRRTKTPIVKDDFVTERSIATTRPKRGGRKEETKHQEQTYHEDDNESAGDSNSLLPSSPPAVDNLETYFEDDGPPEYDQEDEKGDTYFTFPGTFEPSKNEHAESGVSVAGGGYDGNDDEDNAGDEGDPSDKDWSGDENDADEDWSAGKKQTKKKPVPPRPKQPDTPRSKKYAHLLDTIRPDAIVLNDPTVTECPTCHKYIKNDGIASHIATHAKARNFVCTFPNCDKSYFDVMSLRKHEKTHQPEKYGVKCRICFRLFARQDKLLSHERLCAKRMAERGIQVDQAIIKDLTRRSRGRWSWEAVVASTSSKKEVPNIEEGGKMCPHCNLTFQASSFDKHLKSHEEGAKNWSCRYCNKSYSMKRSLIKHITTHHQDEDEPSASAKEEDENGSDDGGVNVKEEVLDIEDIAGDTGHSSEFMDELLETPQL